jgi:hypothetical protein
MATRKAWKKALAPPNLLVTVKRIAVFSPMTILVAVLALDAASKREVPGAGGVANGWKRASAGLAR